MCFKDFFESFDLFGVPVMVNVNGKTKIKSVFGSLMSIIVCVIIFIFTLDRLIYIFQHYNPSITNVTLVSYFDANDTINLNDKRFKIAIGVNDYNR